VLHAPYCRRTLSMSGATLNGQTSSSPSSRRPTMKWRALTARWGIGTRRRLDGRPRGKGGLTCARRGHVLGAGQGDRGHVVLAGHRAADTAHAPCGARNGRRRPQPPHLSPAPPPLPAQQVRAWPGSPWVHGAHRLTRPCGAAARKLSTTKGRWWARCTKTGTHGAGGTISLSSTQEAER
jgi:hypothetical protein